VHLLQNVEDGTSTPSLGVTRVITVRSVCLSALSSSGSKGGSRQAKDGIEKGSSGQHLKGMVRGRAGDRKGRRGQE
jgi:hypothetical protein